MKKQPPTSLRHFLTELVKQTKELCQRTTRQILASREMAGVSSPPHARPEMDATGEAGTLCPLTLPSPQGEGKAAAKAGVRPDDPPAGGGSTEQPPAGPRPIIPAGPAPPEEQAGDGVRPETPGTGRDLKNRVDSARGGVRSQAQGAEELEALLDQAVTLLESVSRHPALRDHSANQRKLDEIEQRLGQSGNVF
jgi:hypothetical protein